MSKEFDDLKRSYEKLNIQEMMVGMSTMATVLFVYHKELIKQGFSETEALYLVAQYQNTLTNPKNRVPDSDG